MLSQYQMHAETSNFYYVKYSAESECQQKLYLLSRMAVRVYKKWTKPKSTPLNNFENLLVSLKCVSQPVPKIERNRWFFV